MRLVFVIITLLVPVMAQEKPKDPSKHPQITVEQRAKFWRAYAEQTAAQVNYQRTVDAMKAVTQELSTTCGDYGLESSPTPSKPGDLEAGELMCGKEKKPHDGEKK